MKGKYFSMKSKRTFQRGYSSNLQVTDKGLLLNTIFSCQPEISIKPDENGRPPLIKDFAVDKKILIYILDEFANIWVYDVQGHNSECLIKGGMKLFSCNARIAVSGDTILAADPAGEDAVIAFSCREGYPLWSKSQVNGLAIHPFAAAAGKDGSFYILSGAADEDASSAGGDSGCKAMKASVLKFDKSGEFLGNMPVTGLKIANSCINNPEYIKERFSICCGEDDRVFLLDSQERIIYCQNGEESIDFLFKEDAVEKPSGLGTDNNGNIYLGDFRRLDPQLEDDRFLMIFDNKGNLLEKIPGYRGSIDKVVVEGSGRAFAYNGETGNLQLFKRKKKIMPQKETGGFQGIYLSHSFDSKTAENQWHRIELLDDIPEETQVALSYFASDTDTLNYKNNVCKIDDFIKSNELGIADKMSVLNGFWNETVFNPSDVLIHKAKGRYLWLCLQLRGTCDSSPSVSRIRVHYSRNSLLQYLPMIYQEDPVSRDFLDRYLSIYETFFSGFEEEIVSIPSYFDVKAVKGDYLRWLSTWIGIPEELDWDEELLRRFMENSQEIYRKRGTRRGLEKLIEIFTGEKPFIVEYQQIKYMKDNPEMLPLMKKLYSNVPNNFVVLVKKECIKTRRMTLQLEKLLEEEKPAFTEAHLVILEENLYLDSHSYLGINSKLTQISFLYLNEGAVVPFDTVLADGKNGL